MPRPITPDHFLSDDDTKDQSTQTETSTHTSTQTETSTLTETSIVPFGEFLNLI